MCACHAEPFSQCLEAQAAAIARRQGRDVGVDPETMRSRVRSGRWQRLQRGVYAAFSGEPARETSTLGGPAPSRSRCGPEPPDSSRAARPDRRAELRSSPSRSRRPGRPARAKIPGVVIHRSDAILRTTHPAMLPPCTRVEDTVLDLIQIAPTFDDAYAWICRAVGRRRTTADRIRHAMDARKKMRWRRELIVALGDAGEGALSLLEYRYVHRVERPHGLARRSPTGANQAAHWQQIPRQPLRGVRGLLGDSTGPRRIPPTSSGVTSAATTPTRSTGIVTLRFGLARPG